MKKSELRDLILEAYAEVLSESELPETRDVLLGRFPTLKKTVENLFTKQYTDFIETIDWVSPKPSTFRIVLKNQQAFYIKWTGSQFQAQIEGKKYMLSKTDDFQQALDRLAELLKQSKPVEEPESADTFEEPGETTGDFGIDSDQSSGEEEFNFEEPGEAPAL
jgi:hypothetical protein